MLKTERQLFLFWVKERERIRLQREAGEPPPWTKDHTLATFRFCNVVRNDDRVTKWIHERAQDDFNLFASRWFNEPATLEYIGWPWVKWNADKVLGKLFQMANDGKKIFRAAYIINGAIPPWGRPKYEKVVRTVLTPAHPVLHHCIVEDSCEETWLNLLKLDGMGQFMAGQVVADWHAKGVINGEDVLTWAPRGPGSRRGLAVAYGRDPREITQPVAVQMFTHAFDLLRTELPDIAKRMTLHDVQNCFCEFSKYRRGYGKQRFVAGG